VLDFKLNAPLTGRGDLQIIARNSLLLKLKQWNCVYAVGNTHFRKGTKNTAKKETAQPPERYEERKKKK